MAGTGAYVWKLIPEWTEGLDTSYWEAEWDDEATPSCDLCFDWGEWVSEMDEVETCPECGGKSAPPEG